MISAIIMASGFGRRMNKEKLVMPVQNVPMIKKVLIEISSSKVEEIILVYRNVEVMNICKEYNTKMILNKRAYLGQSESIKLGIINSSSVTEGYMFFVGDQPFIKKYTIDKLIYEFNKDKNFIIVPRYSGKRGNPVIFPNNLKDQLMDLKGDIGGRNVINSNIKLVKFVDIEDEKQGLDVDDLDTYSIIN
ncbi:molybdenum hydroxylase accessory protein, YgfJ family [Clostridium tetanomorphum DSM 665]|uniref:NTP transferase domain-containing protein n=1 Tax=Clostridium tetanomorphum TaxID=1553 RepID=A0A923EAX2_CLOTT|nr:NTP transferase domain-containing protein [Clostridium tetanomorphum]KAJ48804.1 molybdenum hydroxylase accessory protein, YgfJ family [Clostridium tetanomorphum DSM 665]KAJ52061.1 molybdenum hydroxylase accessory protein, YgfJ family [Clostridium tetanomorphum DSM 665]MBC2397070.1 NTP transferase domain-containing protein [Clostridium tetanomorphum]MBP1862981.1 molybdenum cofactor cytidylyltransferase [Clostridium tetanomorphum]NRZ99086.1 molybdenum cofactor cytidylyltransferase [Clostridiu